MRKGLFLVQFKIEGWVYPDKNTVSEREYRLVEAINYYDAIDKIERALTVDRPYDYSKKPIDIEAFEVIY